ncbi:MAG: response regulator [Candidatus Latescibacteria bacterium]|nr:response regulator [Candidatus Latescibacterota bacterium]
MDTAVRSKRILILDDEPGILELLDSCLRSFGFETLPTSLWTEAVELLTHHPPDLVLLDLQMPTVQGDTVLEFIQQLGSPIPVIIVSAYLDEQRVESLRRLGARRFVSKPFQINALIAAIRETLGLPSEGLAPSPPLPKALPAALPEVPLTAPSDSDNLPIRDTVQARLKPEAAAAPVAPTRSDPKPQQGHAHRQPHHHRRRKPRNLKLYAVISLVCLIGSLVVLLIEKLPSYFSSSLEQAVEKSVQSEAKRQKQSIEGLSDKQKEAFRKAMEKR